MKKLLIVILFAPLMAVAQKTVTGNNLLAEIDGDYGGKMYAYGLILGVMDTSPIVCVPSGVTTGQATQVVRKYMIENPAMLHLNGAAIAGYAMSLVWPCKKGNV